MSLPSLSKTTAQFCSGILLTTVITMTGCQQQPEYGYIEGETMGTSYHISYRQSDEVSDDALRTSINNRLVEINNSMSTYQDDSTISKFNALAAGGSLTVDADFIKVFNDSKQVHQLSGGAFDPTVMPLINLWGFGKTLTVDRLQNPPAIDDITKAKKKIDFDSITLSGDKLTKLKDGIELDFSAIAKGYGVDAIADVLENQYSIKNYMVEIGGEVSSSGVNAQSQPWLIAIDAPILDSSVTNRLTIAAIRQPSTTNKLRLATSGNYRNSVIFDNKRFSHTIDPTTGQPIVGGAPSVTVAADTVSIADAWATALTAMPYKKALKTANANHIAALFVIPKGGDMNTDIPNMKEIVGKKENPLSYWEVVETTAMENIRANKK